MERSTRTIETPRGPLLFSPVLANQLARGDLIVLNGVRYGIPWRITRLRRMPTDPTRIELLWTGAPYDPGASGRLEFGLNDTMMRAVGVTAGGLL